MNTKGYRNEYLKKLLNFFPSLWEKCFKNVIIKAIVWMYKTAKKTKLNKLCEGWIGKIVQNDICEMSIQAF